MTDMVVHRVSAMRMKNCITSLSQVEDCSVLEVKGKIDARAGGKSFRVRG